jgi:autotransporter-associated beta strand protein
MPRTLRYVVGGFIVVLTQTPASAQTWSGNGGSGSWNAGGNWLGGAVPASGATTAITFTGTNQLATTQDIPTPPFILNSLTFDASAGAFTVAGNELRFGGATNSLTQSSANPISITAPVSFNASGSIGGAGAGSLTLGNLAVLQGTLTLNRNVTVGALTIGSINGAAATLNTGSNVLTLNGDVTFVQLVTPASGDANTVPATINGVINLGGANRTFAGTYSSSTAQADLIINATITGTGGFVKGGSTTDFRSWILLNAANTYTGPTILQVGSEILMAGVNNALPSGTALTVSGTSTADYSALVFLPDTTFTGPGRGTSQTVGSLSDGGSSFGEIHLGTNNNSTAVLTIGTDNTSTTFSGIIRRGGQIVKVGTGTLTLSNNDSTQSSDYSGGTTINGGTILVNGQTGTNSGTGSGPVVVNAAGTLGGNGHALGAITLAGRIQGGDGVTVTGNPTLTTGAVTFSNGSTLRVAVGGATPATVANSQVTTGSAAFNRANSASVLTIHLFNDGTLNLNGLTNYSITLVNYGSTNATAVNYSVLADNFSLAGTPIVSVTSSTLSLSFTPVPEPAVVFGLAAVGAIGVRLRRKHWNG